MAPPKASLVALNPKPPLAAEVSPEVLATDPAALIQFVEQHPDRLNVEKMDPALVLSLSTVLLQADRTFMAERLLADASARWPERVDLLRAWGRVLVSIGRPTAARALLTTGVQEAPKSAVMQYLLGRACLGERPPSPKNERCALKAFKAVLELEPAFKDPDGITAQDLRGLVAKLSSSAQ